ncbi:phytanoyl-CoA dioxygenase family protein [uncultured Microbulbifer sp.]|uniref:phytanoyl-CoA dioxygenase family protein n=1 Tax=uncultured Microbulbifer sp. TaxID=348147 RepID=UPI00262240B2|nr:phytanoyl-CoA dioxygenase family protein [uncultured Microbulbifer sp.]
MSLNFSKAPNKQRSLMAKFFSVGCVRLFKVSELECGYAMIRNVMSDNQLVALQTNLVDLTLASRRGGIRNAEKKFSSIALLAKSGPIFGLVHAYLSKPAQLVRAILFEKNEENNWFVTWHQDKTVAVSSPFDGSAWGPWSLKDGVHHVQPPLHVLKEMITLRVHLDDTGIDNGCLWVLPYSQREGVMGAEAVRQFVAKGGAVSCEARAGDVLVMCPYILHSSNKACLPGRRRVIHLEYSSFKLPCGVKWA